MIKLKKENFNTSIQFFLISSSQWMTLLVGCITLFKTINNILIDVNDRVNNFFFFFKY